MSNNVVGRWSSFAVFVVGVGYIVALVIGFMTRGLSAPIVDPLLAVMEVLTLIAAPLMLVMMAAIHGRARDERKTVSSIALAFMILMTGMTSVVHFVELTAMRQLGSASLVWPSPVYALELLAWDVFLGLSLVFAAFTSPTVVFFLLSPCPCRSYFVATPRRHTQRAGLSSAHWRAEFRSTPAAPRSRRR